VYRFPFRDALAPERIDELMRLRRRVSRLVQELGARVILLNGVSPSAFFCLAAAEAVRVPLLVRVNQEVGQRSSRRDGNTLARHVLGAAAWVVGVSDVVLRQWIRLAPQVAARSSVVYSGVDAPAAPPPPAPRDPPHLLCLGRLIHKKGFDVALAALPALLRRWPETRLTIAGDGPERAALQTRAAELALGSRVVFRGWVAPDEVSQLLSSATVVLLPSRCDGLPTVALQAAAAGRPVVATRCGGIPEVVQHTGTGVLADLDGDAFAAAIASLLDQPAAAARMGRAAWERARTLFSQQRCVDEYDALCRRLGGVEI
jgi:glycogen(starch) synthase